ncbi:hypothetical protein PLICRDRAFT_145799 [Plicaturopsis crispa FD-325 SS-3]|uniref:Thioredoxin domain-containing protein n=1 Tax=Plicaturopsis crispa FD-325 SS-3 TaxID=944288 RepID=A0A0C9SYJ8_PLICR|nr:hypothetical protein PLICRDRAFT_145799 [Plicaturopsis crispa FD-325 SS-3]
MLHSATTSQVSLGNRAMRKPPSLSEYSPRYPEPDPEDPFAPLWVLRSRTTSTEWAPGEVPDSPHYARSSSYASRPRRVSRSSLLDSRRPHTTESVCSDYTSPEPQRMSSPLSRTLSGHSQRHSRVQTTAVAFPCDPPSTPHASRDLRARRPATSDNSDHSALSSTAYGDEFDPPCPSFLATHFQNLSSETMVSMSSHSGSRVTRLLQRSNRLRSASLSPPVTPPYEVAPALTTRANSSSTTSPTPSKTEFSTTVAPEHAEMGYRRDPRPAMDVSRRPYSHVHHPNNSRRTVSRPTTAPAASPSVNLFEENTLPSTEALERAAELLVVAESGVRVPFGDLWRGQKTVVIFIRHFWCPLCQDYMTSISKNVDPAVLKEKGMSLVIISNGSHGMIKKYRQIFRTPFAVFTDPSMQVYSALGMTLRTVNPGPNSERGGYVHHGFSSGIAMVVLNALKVGMPVWEKGGDVSQLGGEFVLGPGLTCSYAHRMTTTRSHAPIVQVLAAAGVVLFARPAETRDSVTEARLSEKEEKEWMDARRMSLTRLMQRRSRRRGIDLCGDSSACSIEQSVEIHTDDDSENTSTSDKDEILVIGRPRWDADVIEEVEEGEDHDASTDASSRARSLRSRGSRTQSATGSEDTIETRVAVEESKLDAVGLPETEPVWSGYWEGIIDGYTCSEDDAVAV